MAIKYKVKIKREKKQFKYLLNNMLKSNFSAIFDLTFEKDIESRDFLNLNELNKAEDLREKLNLNISEYPKYSLYGIDSVIFGMWGLFFSVLVSMPFTLGTNPIVNIGEWLLSWSLMFLGYMTTFFISTSILANKLLKSSKNCFSIPLYNTYYDKNKNKKNNQKEINNLGTIYDKNYFKILNDNYDYEFILKLLFNLDILISKSTNISGYQVVQNLMDAEILKNTSLNNQYKRYFINKLNKLKTSQFDTLRRKKVGNYNIFLLDYNTFGNLNYLKIYSSFVLFKDEKGLAIFKKHQMLFEIITNFLELQNNFNKNSLSEEDILFIQDIEKQIKLFTTELDEHISDYFQNKNVKEKSSEEYTSKLKVLQLAVNSRK